MSKKDQQNKRVVNSPQKTKDKSNFVKLFKSDGLNVSTQLQKTSGKTVSSREQKKELIASRNAMSSMSFNGFLKTIKDISHLYIENSSFPSKLSISKDKNNKNKISTTLENVCIRNTKIKTLSLEEVMTLSSVVLNYNEIDLLSFNKVATQFSENKESLFLTGHKSREIGRFLISDSDLSKMNARNLYVNELDVSKLENIVSKSFLKEIHYNSARFYGVGFDSDIELSDLLKNKSFHSRVKLVKCDLSKTNIKNISEASDYLDLEQVIVREDQLLDYKDEIIANKSLTEDIVKNLNNINKSIDERVRLQQFENKNFTEKSFDSIVITKSGNILLSKRLRTGDFSISKMKMPYQEFEIKRGRNKQLEEREKDRVNENTKEFFSSESGFVEYKENVVEDEYLVYKNQVQFLKYYALKNSLTHGKALAKLRQMNVLTDDFMKAHKRYSKKPVESRNESINEVTSTQDNKFKNIEKQKRTPAKSIIGDSVIIPKRGNINDTALLNKTEKDIKLAQTKTMKVKFANQNGKEVENSNTFNDDVMEQLMHKFVRELTTQNQTKGLIGIDDLKEAKISGKDQLLKRKSNRMKIA